MSYWGGRADESDYAAGAIGSYIYLIKDRMLKDLDNVISKGFPEQSAIASIACLRIIGERFPKNLSVHFGRKDLAHVKMRFEEWSALAGGAIKQEFRSKILEEAAREFELMRALIENGDK